MKKIMKVVICFLVLNLCLPIDVLAWEKKETVYSNLDYTGKSLKNVSTSHLMNLTKEKIDDETELKNILNLNGDETYVLEDHHVTWNSEGKDIFYQGEVEKELPVVAHITYYYNNQKEEAKSIVGKKGHIKIAFEFENMDKHLVSGQTLYTPFVTMLGTVLDVEKNSHVEISRGNVVSNGKEYMVVGIALPGMYENYGLESFYQSNLVTLEFDTDCFEMKNVYFVSSPKVFEQSDLQVFQKMDNLSSKMNELENGMNQISNGALTLKDGVMKLREGSSLLYQNGSALKSGTSSLNEGAIYLHDGLKEAYTGISKLQNGSVEIDENLQKILKGVRESEKKLSLERKKLDEELQQVVLLRKNNDMAIQKLKKANQSIELELKEKNVSVFGSKESIKKQIISMVTAQVMEQVKNSEVDKGVVKQMIDKQASELLEDVLTMKSIYDSNASMIQLLSSNDSAVSKMSDSLLKSISSIESEIKTLDKYLTELESKGVKELASGVQALKSGIAKLYEGSSALENGLENVSNGMNQFVDGVKALDSGALTLEKGTISLQEGIDEYHLKGIMKLSSYVSLLANYTHKTEELVKLSKEYRGFSSHNSKSTVFVSVTKSIKANCLNSNDLE